MTAKPEEAGTIVGASVHLTGSLKDNLDIVVYGSVEGEVESEQNITVGESAKIKGPVTAKVVIVSGTVRGQVTAHEKLEIMPGGKVSGNINTSDLVIHSGAIFNGKASMGKEKEEEAEEKVSKEEKETKEELSYEPETWFGYF